MKTITQTENLSRYAGLLDQKSEVHSESLRLLRMAAVILACVGLLLSGSLAAVAGHAVGKVMQEAAIASVLDKA